MHRSLYRLYLGFALCLLGISAYLFQRQTTTFSTKGILPAFDQARNAPGYSESPFTGAFSRFPRLSALPERQRRMTIVGVWNGDSFPWYLRHFFYTVQLNADVLDLLMINRLKTPNDRCLDFDKVGLNITWGGNVKVHCMDDREWKRRYVDFLCSAEYGWNCSPTEYEDVANEYQQREDKKNYFWRPLRGYVFRDLFPKPENPFWAWLDHDIFVGNFARYPFNVLSQLSFLSGVTGPEPLFMAGQHTAFNLDDKALGTAWKKFPEMRSPAHFTKYINGKMPESSEERYWSVGYLRSDKELPGSDLSYGIYPDMHGDDYFDREWSKKNSSTTYLISGREILLASSSYSRKEVEDLILMERNDPIDDLGGIGWTGGEDGSAYLVQQPNLTSLQAKGLALSDAKQLNPSPQIHNGIIEDQLIQGCNNSGRWAQCVEPHPLTLTNPPVLRVSHVRFKEQQPGHILTRLERDQRPRGYERKLLRHHLHSKRMKWFQLPPFEITEDLVLRYNADSVEVFEMGPNRNVTLFYRKEGEKRIG
jgi:hypothetical protein